MPVQILMGMRIAKSDPIIIFSGLDMMDFTADTIAGLMKTHRGELLRFLTRRVCCEEVAQDLFQETFIRFTGYRDKNLVDNPRAFIFRIAANLATDYLRGILRHANNDVDVEVLLAELTDATVSVEAAVISQQEIELLLLALAELPPKCREVFIMLRLKHCSYAQVERELNISSTMVLKYLNRALTQCRQRLEAD